MDSDILAEAARRWSTPLYLTDLAGAAANLATYRRNFPGALIAYAVKANSDPQLLRRLVTDGAGAEVVNEVELALAVRAGCPPERIVMNGVGKTDSDLRAARAAGVLINAESLDELDALLGLGAGRIGLRMNPGLDAQTHPHLATGSAYAKFGIPWAELPEARRRAGSALESIGAHIGSNVESVEPFEQLAALLATAGATRADIGGGVASMAMVPAVAKAIREHLRPKSWPSRARARCWRSETPEPTARRWRRTTTGGCVPRRPCSRAVSCGSAVAARRWTICLRAMPQTPGKETVSSAGRC
jgi:diaminopimelate decarboxylase